MRPLRLSGFLSLVNSGLVLLVSGIGIFAPQLYAARKNTITVYELFGQDLMNALVGAVLLGAVLADREDRITSKVVWLGCLLYLAYLYGYFCFGLMGTPLYLGYLAIFGISLFGLILVTREVAQRPAVIAVNPRYPRRSVSILFFVCAALMSVIEIKDLITKTIFQPGNITPYDAYYVFDLGFIFPAMGIIGVMNWRGQPWGTLFSGVLLIKIMTLLPALVISDFLHQYHVGHFRDIGFDAIATGITLTATILFCFYQRGIREAGR